MALHWSVHQITSYLSEISGQQDERQAMRLAAERAAEALEAEVAVVAVAEDVRASVGFGQDPPPPALLEVARDGGALHVPRLGDLHCAAWPLSRGGAELLVVGRVEEPLSAEELQLLHGMAQMLGLALQGIRTLGAVRERQHLVETLLQIQRSISSRRPLKDVLDTITAGASGLFEGWAVSLVLVESSGAEQHIVASTHGRAGCGENLVRSVGSAATVTRAAVRRTVARGGGERELLAAPVLVEREVAGSLVADLPVDPAATQGRSELLVAFAQQVSLALTDARAMATIREAFRDPLTGLANRTLFLDRLQQAFVRREKRTLTVVYIDLDGFKAVNDTLGHDAGDRLLQLVAERIRHCTREADTVARLGGDEFAVLLEDAGQDVGVTIAERVVAAVRQPFDLVDREVFVGASVGVAQREPSCATSTELLSWSDLAMYRAKRAGRGRVAVFERAMQSGRQRRISLQHELRRLTGFEDFSVQYQPIVSLGTAEPVGVEALVRWNHPRLGAMRPGQFIPLAEETGMIRELGRWVLARSAREVSRWRAVVTGMHLNVNVSARQLNVPRFPQEVADVLRASGLPPSALTVELTETALLLDPELALRHLRQLRDLGVGISIDDFGTGYSSLSHLRRFPVDEVKIDRGFVRDTPGSPEDLALVRAVVDLGRALHLRTVAEGIETQEQLGILRTLSCGLGQGFLLGAPMDALEVPDYFAIERPAAWTEGTPAEPAAPGRMTS